MLNFEVHSKVQLPESVEMMPFRKASVELIDFVDCRGDGNGSESDLGLLDLGIWNVHFNFK